MPTLTFQQFLEILLEVGDPFTLESIKQISSEEDAKKTNMREHFEFDSTQEIHLIFEIEDRLNITIPDQARSYDKLFVTVWDWFETMRQLAKRAA